MTMQTIFKSKITTLAACLFLGACGVNPSSPQDPDRKNVVVDSGDLCATPEYDSITKSENLRIINITTAYHFNLVSGAATEFKNKIQQTKESSKFLGLPQACEMSYAALEISCDGQIKAISESKSEILTHDQLIAMSPLYVKTAHLCNTVSLEENEALYIIANQLTLQNVDLNLKKRAVLSLTAKDIFGGAQSLKSVTQVPGSALMIHAHTLNN